MVAAVVAAVAEVAAAVAAVTAVTAVMVGDGTPIIATIRVVQSAAACDFDLAIKQTFSSETIFDRIALQLPLCIHRSALWLML